MLRLKVSSEGKSPSVSQDESGATTADPMSELLAIITKKFEEVNMKFEKLDNKLEDMVKETRNTNQCRAGLQHQAQQPRLAVKAGVLEDKKTHESKQNFSQGGRIGDISADRVHDPMCLTSFGDQDYTEPPALACRDDALVNQGHEVAKPCLSPVEMRKSTPAGSLLHAGAASTIKTQGPTFPYNFFLGAFERQARRRICV